MAMGGITRKQPRGDVFMAEVAYRCQRRCTKRVPLGGKEQPGGENYSILEDTSIRCSCFQLLLIFASSRGIQLGSHWSLNSGGGRTQSLTQKCPFMLIVKQSLAALKSNLSIHSH